MTADGARGETASEMAKVLRYPNSNAVEGKKLDGIWTIHSGFQGINRMLNKGKNDPKTAAIRKELDELWKQLKEMKAKVKAAEKANKWREVEAIARKERPIVARINKLSPLIDQFELNVANAIWSEKSMPVEKDFNEIVSHHYGTGGLQPADFRGQPEAERKRINTWVEGQTKDRIKNLIPEKALTPLTRMVLVNAIYFKGEWKSPFKEGATKERDFYLADGKKSKADMMRAGYFSAGRYGAVEADGKLFNTPMEIPADKKVKQPATYPGKGGFTIAELPYKGDELSMVLIAPMEYDGLPGIEEQLTSEKLTGWIKGLKSREMHLKMPKIKLKTSYMLADTLQKMGMKRAFISPRKDNGADFTGIHNTDSLEERLYISQVIHKTFLEINEKGTEAAAATAVLMKCDSAMMEMVKMVPFIPSFNADRPFLLLIRHKPSGAILFMGRIMKP